MRGSVEEGRTWCLCGGGPRHAVPFGDVEPGHRRERLGGRTFRET